MILHFDLAGTTPHDNMNLVPAVDTVIAAGSIIDDQGATVAGVSFSLADNPFQGIGGPNDGGILFAEVNDEAERRPFNMNATFAFAEMVISGLPAGDYTVTVYGSRNLSSDYPADMSLNGRPAVSYNASNVGTYEDHIAVDTITLDGVTDLAVNISHQTGVGKYAYANYMRIESAPGPSIADIDSDNEVARNQTGVVINCNNTPAAVTTWSAQLGGVALVAVDWNGGNPIVDIPGNVPLSGDSQLDVDYTE